MASSIQPKLDDDTAAYLIDPEDRWGRLANPEASVLAEREERFVVVLAELGLGKSQVLAEEVARLGTQALLVNLLEIDSADELRTAIVDDQRWQAWQAGQGPFTLLVDSVDESPLGEMILARKLEQVLRASPRERLRIRLACRASRRLERLEHRLSEALSVAVQPVVLLPLRRRDVELAAKQVGVPPTDFLRAVDRARLSPLAATPVTLPMLFTIFRTEGGFPATRSEVYKRGLAYLSDDPPERRDAARREHRPSVAARIAVARRIAAYMTLGQQVAVDAGPSSEHAPGAGLALAALAGGIEDADGVLVTVDEATVRAALDTGLFRGEGRRFVWTHASYADYLCAAWLAQRPSAQILSLVNSADEAGSYIVTKLRDTTVFLAELRPELLPGLIDIDVDLALRAAAVAQPADRRRLTELVIERGVRRPAWPDYPKLNHPGLAEYLRDIVENSSRPADERAHALEIARWCREVHPAVTLLLPVARSLALDGASELSLRTVAAVAAWRIGSSEDHRAMEPLARGQAGPDPHGDLRGIALLALWPRHWSTAEVLTCLPPPPDPHHSGFYEGFLKSFAADVALNDVPALLRCIRSWPRWHQNLPVRGVEEMLIARTWVAAAEPALQEALVEVALDKIHGLVPGFAEGDKVDAARRIALTDTTVRRAITQRFLNHPRLDVDEVGELVSAGLLPAEDLDWLLTGTLTASTQRKPAWARAVRVSLPVEATREFWDALRTASVAEPVLGTEMPSHLIDRLSGARPPATPPDRPQPRATSDLSRALIIDESVARWHAVLEALAGLGTRPDIAASPSHWSGWPSDVYTQRVLTTAALDYLNTVLPPESDRPINTWHDETPEAAVDAAQALLTLHALDRLDDVSPNLWEKWAPTAVGVASLFPIWFTGVLIHAYDHAPATAHETLSTLTPPAATAALDKLDSVWDDHLAAIAQRVLYRADVDPDTFDWCASQLLRHGDPDTISMLRTLTTRAGALELEGVQWLTWLTSVEDVLWRTALVGLPGTESQEVWASLSMDAGKTRQVLLAFAEPSYENEWESLADDVLGAIAGWLLDHVPAAPERNRDGAVVTAEQLLTRLRRNSVYHLAGRATRVSLGQLRMLLQHRPADAQLEDALKRGIYLARESSWQPLAPAEVKQLVASDDQRYVSSADALLTLVCESIDRFLTELRGPLPGVSSLWNEWTATSGGPPRRRPKGEEHLSTEIARWLKRDLKERQVVVGREVHIKTHTPTDVHVVAIRPATPAEPAQELTVVVEVKGCWNRELMKAMENQLVGRYLRPIGLRHGIYVVGWFVCVAWDNDDYRSGDSPKCSPEELAEELSQQAAELRNREPGLRLGVRVLDLSWL